MVVTDGGKAPRSRLRQPPGRTVIYGFQTSTALAKVRGRTEGPMYRFMLLALLVLGCAETEQSEAALTAPEDDDAVCAEAAALVESCTGRAPELPFEGCVDEFRQTAEDVVAGGCEALDTSGGKADAGGFWCWPVNRWMGMCDDRIDLGEAGRIDTLSEICNVRRDTELCGAIGAGDWASARIHAAKVARYDLSDEGMRAWLRDRAVGLFAWNVLTDLGRRGAEPSNYTGAVDTLLKTHFPGHDPETLAGARQWLVPEIGECSAPRAAVLLFPGVVRLVRRDEFDQQRAALEDALPCVKTYRVDSGSFVDPGLNAKQAASLLEQIDIDVGPDAPLHLLGYSQGSSNALRTLVDFPHIAGRARTVITMNSAARGSQVVDVAAPLFEDLDLEAPCERVPAFGRPACRWAARLSPVPAEFLLELFATAMGIPSDELQGFIEAEDGVDAAPTKLDFLRRHLPGVRSLTTKAADAFWSERAAGLPRHVVYLSFRSVITDDGANLPPSNALFWHLLKRAGGAAPFNDMQVLLTHQRIGGPVADLEVTSPVAEGNHWQWELATGAVPPTVMPEDMTDRIPHRELLVGYYQAIAELGLLTDD